MKKCIFLIAACVLFSICDAQERKVNVPESDNRLSEEVITVVADKYEHDFGKISETGGIVNYEFKIKNTGSEPLVITKVTTSCGCTVPDWTKEPVAAGKNGFVKVTFDPKGRVGDMTKTLVVYTNGNPESVRLKIKGSVE